VLTEPLTPTFIRVAMESAVDLRAVGPVLLSMFAAGGDGDEPGHRLERGEISLDEFYELLGEAGQLSKVILDPSSPHFAIRHLVPSDDMHRFLAEVRAERPVAVVSNVVHEWLPWWRAVLPPDELDLTLVMSCEVGLRKPDPRIYLLAAERLGVAPEDVLFLDDFPVMVEAARGVGMHAVHVTDHAAAIAEARRLLAG
jgi:epoxide hydrolase-like predicted phosphatase